MALAFLADRNEGLRFDASSLDKVLSSGRCSLYKGIIQQHLFDNRVVRVVHRRLAIEELPKQVFTEGNVYSVRWNNSHLGAVFL